MDKSKRPLGGLGPAQTAYVAAAMRFRVLLAAPVMQMLGATSEEAVEKALKRLKASGWLTQIQLPGRRAAYTLSREAVLALGLSKKALKAMGQASVVANVAMLAFCARKRVERLTADEVRSSIPDLDRPGLQLGNFFTDTTTDPPRLTWMLVDRGSSPPVLVRKAGTIVKKGYRFPGVCRLIEGRQFAIVILVPNARKKWLVDRVLAKRFFPQVSVSVEVISDIEPLLLS